MTIEPKAMFPRRSIREHYKMREGKNIETKTETIHLTSLVSSRTKEGVVELNWGDKKAQLSPEEARAHALKILECADAAETDAFIVKFFVERLGQEFEAAARILQEFRAFRDERLKEKMS